MEGPRPEGTETPMATPSVTPKADLGSLRIHDGELKSTGMGRRITISAIPVVIFAGIVAAAFAFRSQKPMVEVVSAAKPDAGGLQTLLNASGYITPRRRATIAAKITGRVTGVFFDEGTRVAQEQLLATLDDLDVKRALDAAKADREAAQAAIADYEVQLRNANIQLKRAQDLQSAVVQTQEALDNARTAVDSLKAKIALARQQVSASESRIGVAQQAVDNCTIRAPFAGIVVSKDAQVGEMVSPNSAGGGFTRTGIATIVDIRSNDIAADVNESYIARGVNGQQVTAVLDAYPDWEIPSRVRTVIPSADRQKATVKVRISFLKLDPRILPDMGVKVTFLGEEKHPAKSPGDSAAGVLVPERAVREDNGKKIVFLLKENRAERRAVTVGNTVGGDAEIIGGLTPGDAVIVKGPPDIRDGQSVAVRK